MTSLYNTVPVDEIVKITPSTLDSGTEVGYMNGLILTISTVIAQGTFKQYSSYKDVATDFTTNSVEAEMAQVYFSGYDNNISTPTTLYFYGVGQETIDANKIMTDIISQSQSFASFTTAFQLTEDQLKAFATWTGSQNCRYWFVAWDNNDGIIANINNSFGAWLINQNIDGTTAIYKDPLVAAFCLGYAASLNFDQIDGRTNLCYRANGLLQPTVTNDSDYKTLISNGYNIYVPYANGLKRWQLFAPGSVSGGFKWADSYVNQIWLNGSIQAALMDLIVNVPAIPYNAKGDALVSSAINTVMLKALNFGAIATGIQLSDQQKQELAQMAGKDISDNLYRVGYYVNPNASTTDATVRGLRQSPPIQAFYTDGQSVQTINVPVKGVL